MGEISASNLGLGSTFDLSVNALTVSSDIGSRYGAASARSVGVSIGDVVFMLHPGYNSGAGGAHRVQSVDSSTFHQSNTDLGFTPGTGDNFTAASISVIENGSNYDFSYSMSDGTTTYNNSISIAQTSVDDVTGGVAKVGLWIDGGGDGNYQNFQVSQIPEASTIGAMFLFALAALVRACPKRVEGVYKHQNDSLIIGKID